MSKRPDGLRLLMSAFFFVSISCRFLSLQDEEAIRGNETYYLIDPYTILSDIAQGKTDIFKPQLTTPQPALSQSLSKVKWTQEDYLSVVEALHKFVWNDSIDDWQIRHILFYVNCDDVSSGPQSAYFILYKVVEEGRQSSRFEHEISIDPSNNSASWSDVEYSPNLVAQSPIELSKYKVSISDALQIAEANGGSNIRLGVENECFVSAQLSNLSNSWQVSYVKVLDLYTIDIDPLTGKFEVVDPTKK